MSHDEAAVRAEIARTLDPVAPRNYASLAIALSQFDDCPDLAPGETVDGSEGTYLVRVLAKRNAGKIVFTQLSDAKTNDLIQGLTAPQGGLSTERIQEFKSTVHIGDILSVTGSLTLSNTGERTLLIQDFGIATKCVAPFPKMTKTEAGLAVDLQPETIHNDPTLHLLVDPMHRDHVRQRALMLRSVRRFFEDAGFLEVETPILSHTVGGASAARFTTHAHATGEDLNLRVAPELYLKRLVIGGLGNVFEIGKNFRNEGIDRTHSPEFTSLEAYALGEDYKDQLEHVRRLFNNLFEDFGDFTYLDFFESLSNALGVQVDVSTPADEVAEYARARGADIVQDASVEDVFDALVVPTLSGFTAVLDYPRESTPLAADHRSRPGVCEKWDVYVGDMEVATGYTENTNAAQIAELMPEDSAFVRDMRYGLPPLGGLGIGIDRLAMLVCGTSSIHETLHTPHATA